VERILTRHGLCFIREEKFMKVKITEIDLKGENKKCSYVLAYFRAMHLCVGDFWQPHEYMAWIEEKHRLFHQMYGLPEFISYDNDHNEALYQKFLGFLNCH
jgi:hypothetical protein